MNDEFDQGQATADTTGAMTASSTRFDPESEAGSEEQGYLATCVRVLVVLEKRFACLFLVLILTTMAVHVIARYVFGSPFQWSEEAARLALIWMTFISAAYVMAEGRHIAVDMVSARLGDRGKLVVECLGYVVVAVACLMLFIGGARFVWYVGKVESPALGVPKSWWYGAGMAGLLLMALHNVLDLFQVWTTGKPVVRESDVAEEGFQLEMEQSE